MKQKNGEITKQKIYPRHSVILFLVLFTCLRASTAWSQPNLTNYQGMVTGQGIQPNGQVDMTFSVYNAAVGGTLLWAENQPGIQLDQGVYNVLLGQGTTTFGTFDTNLFSGNSRWSEVVVNSQVFTPRIRFVSAPFSLKADEANTVGGFSAINLTDYTDTEILNHGAIPDAHHLRYTDGEAVNALGAKSDGNPLNHDKTTGFGGLTGTANDAQIPNNITIDHAATAGDTDTVDGVHAADLEESSEIDSDIATHTTTGAHHTKTTNAGELTSGTLADGRIPASITRETELNAHKANASDHHTEYTDAQAKAAASTITSWGHSIKVTDLNADKLEGFHAGNSSGYIPINNGAKNINLNADLLDGKDSTQFLDSSHTSNNSAHHSKTTSASQITSGTMSPSRISGTAWTGSNDGPNSGLDADRLDGMSSSQFLSTSGGTISGSGSPVLKVVKSSGSGNGLQVDNNGSGYGLKVNNNSGSHAIVGDGRNGYGVWGSTYGLHGVHGESTSSGYGVYGYSAGAYGGYFKTGNSSLYALVAYGGNNGSESSKAFLAMGKSYFDGAIYQRGSQLHADYVFEKEYKLESIAEHANFMWENKHLKAIPKAKTDNDGKEIIEVGAHRKGIVEELEKAHIYISQLEERLARLEALMTNIKE